MHTRFVLITLCLTMLTLAGCAPSASSPPPAGANAPKVATGGSSTGDAQRGRRLLAEKGCVACHTARGVPEATGSIGPTLTGSIAKDRIAEAVPNTPENMKRWLMTPQAVKPGTMMPQLALSDQDAEDIIAFLETIR